MKFAATKSRLAVSITVLLVATIAGLASLGFAASLGVTSRKLTVLQPSELPPVCSGTDTQTVDTTNDSWISQGSQNQNKGTDSAVYVMTKNSANERTLVGFSLPTLPPGCSVTSATLRLWNDAPSGTRVIQARRITSDWDENTVTWNNAPSTASLAADSQVPSSAGWQSWTVTGQVQAMYTNGAYGFQLRDKSEGCSCATQQKYLSLESGTSTDAELIVTWG